MDVKKIKNYLLSHPDFPSLNSIEKTFNHYNIENIISEFISKNGTSTLSTVIVEYCWRLIVIDLRNINDFLKNQKNEI